MITCTAIFTALLVYSCYRHWGEVSAVLSSASWGDVLLLTLLLMLPLFLRCELWHRIIVGAGIEGVEVSRPQSYLSAAASYPVNALSTLLGVGVKIAVMRACSTSAPSVGQLLVCEAPLAWVEGILALVMMAITASLTGVPSWCTVALMAGAAAALIIMRRLHRSRAGSGLGVMGDMRAVATLVAMMTLVWAVQIGRFYLALDVLGADASLFAAAAAFVICGVLSSLPIGSLTASAASIVAVLGANGAALAAGTTAILFASNLAGALICLAITGAIYLRTLRPAPSPAPMTGG